MVVLLTWLLLPPPCALAPPALSTPHHQLLNLRDLLVGAVLPPTRSALGPGVAAAIDHWQDLVLRTTTNLEAATTSSRL